MSFFAKNSAVEDHLSKQHRICVPFSITFHATPASKVHSTDLPGVAYLSTEGKTAEATAVDSGDSFTTENDGNGIFGILLANLGTVEKVYDAQVVGLSAGTAAVSKKGASSSGVTASGNIAISIDSNQDLSMTSLSGVLIVDYRVKEA